MKRIVAGVLALASLAAFGVANAQNARIITFQEAIRIALDQNTSVRAAENAAALGKVGVSEARSQFLPNLTFSSSGSQNFEAQNFPMRQASRSCGVRVKPWRSPSRRISSR
jgi:outer membrane protein TolC